MPTMLIVWRHPLQRLCQLRWAGACRCKSLVRMLLPVPQGGLVPIADVDFCVEQAQPVTNSEFALAKYCSELLVADAFVDPFKQAPISGSQFGRVPVWHFCVS